MASINYAAREISVKIVYYGPGLSGKTTNLQIIHRKVPKDYRSDMVSLATETDRTLFFDFLPLNLGKIKGFAAKFQLYTVPGQVYYSVTRKLVLRGVDGIVFVADSQAEKMDENIESFQNMEDNLAEYGYNRDEIPIIMQYNKRDLPTALPVDQLQQKLNKYNMLWTEAIAPRSVGVFETLKLIGKTVIDALNKKYSKQRPAGAAPKPAAAPPRPAAPPPPQQRPAAAPPQYQQPPAYRPPAPGAPPPRQPTYAPYPSQPPPAYAPPQGQVPYGAPPAYAPQAPSQYGQRPPPPPPKQGGKSALDLEIERYQSQLASQQPGSRPAPSQPPSYGQQPPRPAPPRQGYAPQPPAAGPRPIGQPGAGPSPFQAPQPPQAPGAAGYNIGPDGKPLAPPGKTDEQNKKGPPGRFPGR
jgi:signal recognition particle receptor subunit beta